MSEEKLEVREQLEEEGRASYEGVK